MSVEDQIDSVVRETGVNVFLVVAILGGLGWGAKIGTDEMITKARRARVESLVNAAAGDIPRFDTSLYTLAATGEGGMPGAESGAGNINEVFSLDKYIATLPKPTQTVKREAPKPTPPPFANLVLPPVDIESPPVDYAAMLGDKIRADGLIDNGAFINGRFYKFGDEIRMTGEEEQLSQTKVYLVKNYQEGDSEGVVVNIVAKNTNRLVKYPLVRNNDKA